MRVERHEGACTEVIEESWHPVFLQEQGRGCGADAARDGEAAVPVDEACDIARVVDEDVLEVEVGVVEGEGLAWVVLGVEDGVGEDYVEEFVGAQLEGGGA